MDNFISSILLPVSGSFSFIFCSSQSRSTGLGSHQNYLENKKHHHKQNFLDSQMDNFASSTPLPADDTFLTKFQGVSRAYLFGDHKYLFPTNAPKVYEDVKAFKARQDDVYVATFPKSGTTWMQEIVYLLANNADTQFAKKSIRDMVFPFIDLNVFELPPSAYINMIEIAQNLPSPRLIKTHLPYCLLPPDVIAKKCKIIYVSRNARDTITSYYHFAKAMYVMNFVGSFEEYFDLFLDDKVPSAPYVSHVEEFWHHRADSNVFFTTYEELTRDQQTVIGKVAKFLGKSVTCEQSQIIAEYCKFDNMKGNEAANKNYFRDQGIILNDEFTFMRKGIVGDWKNHFTSEMNYRLEKWIAAKTTGNQGLKKLLESGIIDTD